MLTWMLSDGILHAFPYNSLDWVDWEDDVIRNLSKLPNAPARLENLCNGLNCRPPWLRDEENFVIFKPLKQP